MASTHRDGDDRSDLSVGRGESPDQHLSREQMLAVFAREGARLLLAAR